MARVRKLAQETRALGRAWSDRLVERIFQSRLGHVAASGTGTPRVWRLFGDTLPSGQHRLHWAVAHGDVERVDGFLRAGNDIDLRNPSNGKTALHVAAIARQYEAAELLVAKGADVDAKTLRGWTPLHYAASIGGSGTGPDEALVSLLLDGGAAVNERTGDRGRNALHLAVATDLADAVTLVIDADRRGRQVGRDRFVRGRSTTAAGQRRRPTSAQYQVAALLLARGAEVNACDDQGWTPLHHAATVYAPDHSVELAELLLDHGADASVRSTDGGKTPLDHAAATGLDDLVELLGGLTSPAGGAPADLLVSSTG